MVMDKLHYLNIRQEEKVHGDGDIDNAKRKKD